MFRRLLNQLQVALLAKRVAPTPDLLAIHRTNLASLGSVPRWIDDDVYERSVYNYGLPKRVKHLIDEPIGDALTYTDLLVSFSRSLNRPVNYLELGVSVGKNFLQLERALENARLTGFDIEAINPVLEHLLGPSRLIERWTTMPKSLKRTESSLIELGKGRVRYLNGDIWDEASWQRLRHEKFNVIFSDAFHDPNAVLFEFEMLRALELLDLDAFVLVWDDLSGGTTRSFFRIFSELKRRLGAGNVRLDVMTVNGWLGMNEHPHTVGVIRSDARYDVGARFST